MELLYLAYRLSLFHPLSSTVVADCPGSDREMNMELGIVWVCKRLPAWHDRSYGRVLPLHISGSVDRKVENLEDPAVCITEDSSSVMGYAGFGKIQIHDGLPHPVRGQLTPRCGL